MTWLEQQVRQAKLIEIAICIATIAAVIGALVYNLRYFENLRAGPYAIPSVELNMAETAENLPRYWVQITPAQVVDTGVDHITINRRRGVETGRSVTGHFWIVRVSDRLLIVETKGAPPVAGQQLQGTLRDTPANIANRLKPGVAPAWQARILPLMLDTAAFETPGHVGLAASAVIVLVALLWAAWALRRALAPRGHRALRALESSGISLADASQSIDGDIRGGQSLGIGSYRLAREFVVKTGLGFDVRALRDLLWAYPIVVSHKLYGFIPTGKSHQAALYFPDKQLKLKLSKPVAEKLMPLLAQIAPWTLLGHSPELEHAWQKKQRPQLIAFVADRRTQVLAHWAAASSGAATVEPQAQSRGRAQDA